MSAGPASESPAEANLAAAADDGAYANVLMAGFTDLNRAAQQALFDRMNRLYLGPDWMRNQANVLAERAGAPPPPVGGIAQRVQNTHADVPWREFADTLLEADFMCADLLAGFDAGDYDCSTPDFQRRWEACFSIGIYDESLTDLGDECDWDPPP